MRESKSSWVLFAILVMAFCMAMALGCEEPQKKCSPDRKCCPRPAKSYVIVFSATWCGPCRQAEPRVNSLIAAGVDVRKVDIDAYPSLAGKWQVTSVPTFIVISRGRESARTHDVSALGRLLGRDQ